MINLIKKIFFHKTENTKLQLLRYLFVGGFAFFVDYSILISLTEFAQMHYLISAIFGFIAGLIVNYFLSTAIVFSKRTIKSKHKEFIIFSVIGIICLLLNEIIIYISSDLVGIHYAISKIISTVIIFLLNFYIRKKVLFS
jgi:putative flippase GtrA